MNKVPDQLTSANRAGVETLVTMANAAFAGAERMAALNLNAVRSLLEGSTANIRTLLAVKDVHGLVSLQNTLTQPGLEKATVYSRSVVQIATETQEALSEVVEGQVSELNKSTSLALDKAAKTAPAGSDLAVNAIRSALSAANMTYDSMNKAARQITGLAQTNLATATAYKPSSKAA
jgi:phasin family protein